MILSPNTCGSIPSVLLGFFKYKIFVYCMINNWSAEYKLSLTIAKDKVWVIKFEDFKNF